MKAVAWPVTHYVENRARRLNDMIARVGVEPVQLARVRHGEAYLEARKVCIECHRAEACLTWLTTAREQSGPPNFCPNFKLLDGLRQEAAGRAHVVSAPRIGSAARDNEDRDFPASITDASVDAAPVPPAGVDAARVERRLLARLEAAGLDPDYVRAVQADAFQALEVACRGCAHVGRCNHDLNARDVVERLAAYCPNTSIVDELMVERVFPSASDRRTKSHGKP